MLWDDEVAKLPGTTALAYAFKIGLSRGTLFTRMSMGRLVSAFAAGAMAVILSGCETAGQMRSVAMSASAAKVPTSSLRGSGPSITPSYMPEYCRAELATRNVTQPDHVRTNSPVREADGSTTVDGTVEKDVEEGDVEGGDAFRCRFDANGAFVDVVPI